LSLAGIAGGGATDGDGVAGDGVADSDGCGLTVDAAAPLVAHAGPFEGDALAIPARHPLIPRDATAATNVPATINEARTPCMI
jgi:hypothetical protein